ncbi:MAG: exodeoxyribonuclease VII large subunit [Candidatus Kapaibacterium sp.]
MNTLFQNTEDEHPLTVSELSSFIKQTLETRLNDVFVIGEISGYRRAMPSGHSYFVLKDDKSQISCNLWNFRYNQLKFKPEDGMKVLIRGRVTVYEPRGSYAIEVHSVTEIGIGELQAAFERLKEKLLSEGLFDEKRKKQLPDFPQNVAIITSESGAVIEDFIKVSKKRYPNFNLYLFPALVQGKGSVESVCRAIKQANDYPLDLDVIVIARGGGSIEDLWTFNEESVARAVYHSNIPVVSAVGHEVDYTICDFVADLRAPTPSAAAEMILPDKRELLENLNNYDYDLKSIVNDRVVFYKESLDRIQSNYSFNKPRDILNEVKMRIDEISDDLNKIISDTVENYQVDLEEKYDFIFSLCNDRLLFFKNDLDYKEKMLKNISPDNTLKRGFAVVTKHSKIVSGKKELKNEDLVNIRFHDGSVDATVK